MKRRLIACFLLGIGHLSLMAQLGGTHVYDFLGSPGSARVSALGGSLIGVRDGDIAQVQQNPALSNDSMDMNVSLNHIFHFDGINEGMIAYGRSIDTFNLHVHGALQYLSYGTFIESDPIGNAIGEFKASEAALLLGASRKMNERIFLGANLKTLLANYVGMNGFGMAVDVGLLYQVPGKNWTIASVLQNVGFSSNSFASASDKLPLNLQLAFTQRLKHLPFRYSITAHHLQQWNIRYIDPSSIQETDFFGEVIEQNEFKSQVDNLFRHIIFSGEFLFGQRGLFNLRFAYNHLRRQELKVSTFRSLGGFSLGFGMHIKRFQLDYGLGFYHLEGATNHIGVRMFIGDNW